MTRRDAFRFAALIPLAALLAACKKRDGDEPPAEEENSILRTEGY